MFFIKIFFKIKVRVKKTSCMLLKGKRKDFLKKSLMKGSLRNQKCFSDGIQCWASYITSY